MVKLIAGKKGAGKTKLLIEAIHKAEKESKGNVVAIQYGSSLNVDIYHKIRLINIEIGDADTSAVVRSKIVKKKLEEPAA